MIYEWLVDGEILFTDDLIVIMPFNTIETAKFSSYERKRRSLIFN